ncbi:MAG: nucleoside 2-deoxyribosyltransferase [Anaerolineales bacterium]|nr:nucleoside 2-deoxyribosyltransferase [Anaerolineales bacterium]
MTKIYVATFFFDVAGFEYTEKMAQQIKSRFPTVEPYLPQRNAAINDKKKNDKTITSEKIYTNDTEELLSSDILIAGIDGVEIDSGVSCEIGIAAGWNEAVKMGHQGKPIHIIGFYTDMRQFGTGENRLYRNLFVTGAIEQFGIIVRSLDELLIALMDYMD